VNSTTNNTPFGLWIQQPTSCLFGWRIPQPFGPGIPWPKSYLLVCEFYDWWAAFWFKKSTTHFGLWIPQWVLGLGPEGKDETRKKYAESFNKLYSLGLSNSTALGWISFIVLWPTDVQGASLPSQLSNIGQIPTVEETEWETRHDSYGQEVKYTLHRKERGINEVPIRCTLITHDKWNSESVVKGKWITGCFPCQEHMYEIGAELHFFLIMKHFSRIFYCCSVSSDNICNSAYIVAVHLTQSSYERLWKTAPLA
jgi:hypothetical protein